MTWTFVDFLERLRYWIDADAPPEDWRFAVLAWLYEMQKYPYYGATPVPQAGSNAWFARIRDAEDEENAVVCLYTIDAASDEVRCSGFTTLRKPI